MLPPGTGDTSAANYCVVRSAVLNQLTLLPGKYTENQSHDKHICSRVWSIVAIPFLSVELWLV